MVMLGPCPCTTCGTLLFYVRFLMSDPRKGGHHDGWHESHVARNGERWRKHRCAR
jgi:hypothetical protein